MSLEISQTDFEKLINGIASRLNDNVFPQLARLCEVDYRLRDTLNPAFPFPKELRIGASSPFLFVEYVGPSVEEDPGFKVSGIELLRAGKEFWDFLGMDISDVKDLKFLSIPSPINNISFLIGDSVDRLCDYFYDFTSVGNDFVLNGLPDFSEIKEPVLLYNVTFLWSDKQGGLKVRHVDFMEIFPANDEGLVYHGNEASFAALMRCIVTLSHQSVPYHREAHCQLNNFIQLVSVEGTSEQEITKFIQEHPTLLQLALGAHDLNPQTELVWQYATTEKDLKPDFMPTRMDGYVDILDFKLPHYKSKPVVGILARRQPSFEIDSAVAQVNQYRRWCEQEVNRKWLKKTKSINVLAPQKIIIGGQSTEFTAEERQIVKNDRDVTFFTYDEFINMVRFQLYRARSR